VSGRHFDSGGRRSGAPDLSCSPHPESSSSRTPPTSTPPTSPTTDPGRADVPGHLRARPRRLDRRRCR
jgi:hypothetical protein